MIGPELLGQVAALATLEPDIGALRAAFPGLHFSACSEDDVPPRYRPAHEDRSFALFLVSGASGHCLEITHDAAAATGILVATRTDDA